MYIYITIRDASSHLVSGADGAVRHAHTERTVDRAGGARSPPGYRRLLQRQRRAARIEERRRRRRYADRAKAAQAAAMAAGIGAHHCGIRGCHSGGTLRDTLTAAADAAAAHTAAAAAAQQGYVRATGHQRL